MNKKAFTLVELIVVITVLSILGTVAFISLQGYSSNARDSKRTADIGNIKKSLELFFIETGEYPSPDGYSTITYSGGIEKVWFQGVVGDIVSTNLKSLNKKPLDPLTNEPYTYSVTNSYKEYEVLALYEGSVAYQVPSPERGVLGRSLFPQANAATTSFTPKVDGNYNGIFVKTNNYIIPTPTIITSEPLTGGIFILNSTNIHSQITSFGQNIPKTKLTKAKTGALDINLFPSKIITNSSTDTLKINIIDNIQLAYSGSSISNNYSYILKRNTNGGKLDLANVLILKKSPGTTIYCDENSLPKNNIATTILSPTKYKQTFIKDSTSCGFTCSNGWKGPTCSETISYFDLTGCGDSINGGQVKLSNGQTWALCNIGTTSITGSGSFISNSNAGSVCPAGWRLPTQAEATKIDYINNTPLFNQVNLIKSGYCRSEGGVSGTRCPGNTTTHTLQNTNNSNGGLKGYFIISNNKYLLIDGNNPFSYNSINTLNLYRVRCIKN